MNASLLKREIETLLGLEPAKAAALWRLAASGGSVGRDSSDGQYVLTGVQHGANMAPGKRVNIDGASDRFDGKYFVQGATHKYDKSGFGDLFECARAAATGDQATQRIWSVWLRLRTDLERQPAHQRHQLGHELVHTVQQRDEAERTAGGSPTAPS